MHIVLHGPVGPTGIGYSVHGLYRGLRAADHAAVLSPSKTAIVEGRPVPTVDAGWSLEGYHLVIDQPMALNMALPWNGFMPLFELPLRSDEIPKLKISMKRYIYCLNPFIYEAVQAVNPPEVWSQIKYVQLGADVTRVASSSRIRGSVCTVGKAEPRKGTWLLLDALEQLGITGNLAIMHPLHDQQEQERIFKHASKHNVLPFSPNQEAVFALLDVSHIAVFPSCAEGWNLALTEALAHGCFVIASDIEAHRYQYDILKAAVGEEEAKSRMKLLPVTKKPIRPHARWYPLAVYAGQTWQECELEDICTAIEEARTCEFPRPWKDGEFPLSWENAGRRLLAEIGPSGILDQ